MAMNRSLPVVTTRFLRATLLVALALSAVGLTGKAHGPTPSTTRVAAATLTRSPGPATVLFIGGWVTAGGDASVAAAATSPAWQATVRDPPGAALLRGGSDGSAPLARQVQQDAKDASSSGRDLGPVHMTWAVRQPRPRWQLRI